MDNPRPNGRLWAVYFLAGLSLVSGVAQAATVEPRRFIVSALELGASTAFVTCLAHKEATKRTEQTRVGFTEQTEWAS